MNSGDGLVLVWYDAEDVWILPQHIAISCMCTTCTRYDAAKHDIPCSRPNNATTKHELGCRLVSMAASQSLIMQSLLCKRSMNTSRPGHKLAVTANVNELYLQKDCVKAWTQLKHCIHFCLDLQQIPGGTPPLLG